MRSNPSIEGPVAFTALGAAGDEQADRVNHGGPDKAILAYSAEHYREWRTELDRPELPFGAFGENVTIAGLTEADMCIGDRWWAGDVLFEVSQPRQPCWKLARRWRVKSLPAKVIQTGRTGWYLRVLADGELRAGAELELIDRPSRRGRFVGRTRSCISTNTMRTNRSRSRPCRG